MRPCHRFTLLAAVVALILGGCDWNDPDEVQNTSNFAVVRAQFFASRSNRVPVPGVRMVVEADPEGTRPYLGPDIITISGEDGVAVATVFPGIREQSGTGTGGSGGTGGTGGSGGAGTGQTGPRNPLELQPPLVFADTAVAVIYNGQIASLISGGLTVGSGRQYDLGAVYLADLGLVVD